MYKLNKSFLSVNYFVVLAGSVVLTDCLKSHRLEFKAAPVFYILSVSRTNVCVDKHCLFFYFVLHVIFA